MKNILFLLIAALIFVQCDPAKKVTKTDKGNPQVGPVAEATSGDDVLDRSIPPSAGPAPEIQIGDYEKFKLDNGVEVIVVKNSKLPRVSFSLQLDADPMLEGDKAGLIDLTGQLLRRGTTTKSKAELDEEIDFIGASLGTSGTGVFASSLTKHQDKLLGLMSDILLNPAFEETELDKLKKQTMSGLASQKDDPNAIAGNVGAILKYSKDHPYGEVESEETVQNVTIEDCKAYYSTYFRPNTTRLVIVGDVDTKALKGQLEKYFGKWKEGKVPTNKYDTPSAPTAAEVAFVDKAGAVQSVIQITYPVDYKPGSPEAIKARVMNTILGGGGFSGRLMQNLREDKAYTYGARSSLSSNELVGSFTASASVRNEVTDSAVTQFLYEMNRLSEEKVEQDDLNLILNTLTGSFSRALERPETVARFAQNIEKYNLPKDYYKNYLKNLRAVTIDDVQEMAKKYLTPDNAYILVVGNKDEVAEKLAKFSADKKVHYYDTKGNPIEMKDVEVPSDVTAASVIQNFIKASGGAEALKAVKDATIIANIAIGPNSAVSTNSIATGASFDQTISVGGQTMMKQTYEGGVLSANGQKMEEIDAKMKEDLLSKTYIVSEVLYTEGYQMELKGIENINGSDAYKVVIVSPEENKVTAYFDTKSGLKVREIVTQGPQTATVDYDKYQEVEGIKIPFSIKQSGAQALTFEVTEVKINTGK